MFTVTALVQIVNMYTANVNVCVLALKGETTDNKTWRKITTHAHSCDFTAAYMQTVASAGGAVSEGVYEC